MTDRGPESDGRTSHSPDDGPGTGTDPDEGDLSPGDAAVDYREVFRELSDGVVVHDPETGRVLDANPAMCEMVGYDREELVGRTVSAFTADEQGYTEAEARRLIHEAAREGPQVFEWRNRGPDGEPFWVEVNLRRTEFDGDDRVLAVVRDVDDRKGLEDNIESLGAATDHLVRADSKREACERAVEAAESSLSFPFVGVHLFRESDGVLEPVAYTDDAEELLGGAPPAIDSGPTWAAFAAGEPVHYEDVVEAVDGDPQSPVRTQLVLPLGSHGAMVVADPDPGGFDEEGIELAEILAANAEAALNRAEGRRRLREREEELQRETRRADRLERLNRIVRDVEAAVAEASARSGIEREVCERFVGSKPCLQAWIGGVERGTDSPVPRVGADAEDRALVADGVEELPERHPAGVVARSDEPSAIQDVAADAPAGEWRRRAIDYGVGSACAVPLAHGEVDHGVLCVHAAPPDSFDDAVRETLAELGRSIGYALTAVERRRALESDTTTELEFRIADRSLAPVALATATDHGVTLERSVRRSDGSVATYYTVRSDAPIDGESVLSAARSIPGVESVRTVNNDGDTCLLETTARDWFGSLFADQGGVVQSANVEDGTGTLVVETPTTADVRGLVETFREHYPETTLVARRDGRATGQTSLELQAKLESELTERQREVIETAYSAGYFEWPRGSSGEEIAELLGITQPTLNKHLRLAEHTAMSLLLDGEAGEE
jgi:PAS domain S-box-containing protein